MEDRMGVDHWKALRFFLGSWTGTGTGKVGDSRVERTYEFVLGEQFIRLTDRSVYDPQEKNPEGEVHEEIGFFSYDGDRETHVLREFHIEGYVNQYVQESSDVHDKKLVFVTEAVENLPPGMQARTTYEIIDDNRFRETFELLMRDGAWACFITSELQRVEVGGTLTAMA